MSSSLIGKMLGKYEITALLGRGGMATVYKGFQPDLNRNVAIKVLPPHPGRDDMFSRRFRIEAETIARLQHPHILPLFDFGTQDDILYLVMALIEGGSLSDRIAKGPMPLKEVDRLLAQIASALDFAHRQHIIHRDIKPDNVLMNEEGFVLLADFGIAKLMEEDARLTATGGVVGTPAYISPEQAQGATAAPQSDIYSLGAVVFEMVTGALPYQADTAMQLMVKHLNEPVPSLQGRVAEFPPELDRVMQTALAKDPAQRFQTAADFSNAFSNAIKGQESVVLTSTQPPSNATINLSTPAATGYPSMTPPPTAASMPMPTNPTMTVQTGFNIAVLLGALVVIVLLVVVILVLALREDGNATPGVLANATEAPTDEPIPTAVAAAVPSVGRLNFSTDDEFGDTVTLRVEEFEPPGADMSYAVWLLNTRTGERLALGRINIDPLGNGVLTFTDEEGAPLPTVYNAVEITIEEEIGAEPTGEVAYSGLVPPEVTNAIVEIFVTSEQGEAGGSLLDTALREAEIGQRHAGLAASATDAGGLHVHAEHTVNILLGQQEDLDANGTGQNPGLGIGLSTMLDAIEENLNTAASAPQASAMVQNQIEFVRICVGNTRLRMERAIELERILLAADDPADIVDEAAEATELMGQVIEGDDLNGNGNVEAFEDECGLNQIAFFGVLVGNIEIVAGELPDQS